jgi:hypothetical protein
VEKASLLRYLHSLDAHGEVHRERTQKPVSA